MAHTPEGAHREPAGERPRARERPRPVLPAAMQGSDPNSGDTEQETDGQSISSDGLGSERLQAGDVEVTAYIQGPDHDGDTEISVDGYRYDDEEGQVELGAVVDGLEFNLFLAPAEADDLGRRIVEASQFAGEGE